MSRKASRKSGNHFVEVPGSSPVLTVRCGGSRILEVHPRRLGVYTVSGRKLFIAGDRPQLEFPWVPYRGGRDAKFEEYALEAGWGSQGYGFPHFSCPTHGTGAHSIDPQRMMGVLQGPERNVDVRRVEFLT